MKTINCTKKNSIHDLPIRILATTLLFFGQGIIDAAVPAGSLVIPSEDLGNDTYGDWQGQNITWGLGYPNVSVTVDTDERITDETGLERQGILD